MDKRKLEDLFAKFILGFSVAALLILALNYMSKAPNAEQGIKKHLQQRGLK